MNNLKFGILICGAVGLIGLLMAGILKGLSSDAVNSILVLAGFGVPAAMGAMAAAKPPMLRWQAVVSLAGFALVAIKLRVWDMLKVMSLLPMGFKLSIFACLAGIVVSVLALAKPETAR